MFNTEKIKNSKNELKCRLVAKGFQDPMKDSIRKDSPTAGKSSLRLATTYLCNGFHCEII